MQVCVCVRIVKYSGTGKQVGARTCRNSDGRLPRHIGFICVSRKEANEALQGIVRKVKASESWPTFAMAQLLEWMMTPALAMMTSLCDTRDWRYLA